MTGESDIKGWNYVRAKKNEVKHTRENKNQETLVTPTSSSMKTKKGRVIAGESEMEGYNYVKTAKDGQNKYKEE